MSKGKRYDGETKLNLKKVFAVIIALVVIIMAIIMLVKVLTKAKNTKSIDIVNYFALYNEQKWGILGSNGKIVVEPMYQEMPIVIDSSKDVFLITYDINEEDGTYKTKAINKNNEEIFTNYDKIEALENYDESENVWYEEDVLKVQKDGKWGLIDLNGKQIAETIYDNIETLKGFKKSIIVEKDGQKGLINDKGVKILDTKYKDILQYGEEYGKGYITVDQENKYGIVNFSGNTVLENKYEKIENIYSEKYFIITQNGKQVLIDEDENTLLDDDIGKIKQIANSGVIFEKDNKFGLMGFDKTTLIEPTYDNLKEINKDVFVATKDTLSGIIDKEQNEKLTFSYKNISYNKKAGIYIADDEQYNSSLLDSNFEVKVQGILSEINTDDGYLKIKVGEDYKFYNFKFEEKNIQDIYMQNTIFAKKQDGKYGFVDSKQNTVVDFIYDDVTELNKYGFAAVKKDGLWGAIDKERKSSNRTIIQIRRQLSYRFYRKVALRIRFKYELLL